MPTAKQVVNTPKATRKMADRKPARRGPQKAALLSSKLVYKGNIFSVFRDHVTEPGGVTSYRDIVRHAGSVVVLAVDDSLDPADPLVVVERQYRHAAGQYLLELPAGKLDKGETPLAGAKREMIEETGYTAKKWKKLVRYYPSPGYVGEWMEIYLATQIVEGEAQPEEDERIEVRMMPLSTLLKMIRAGKIHDGKTIVGVLTYAAQIQKG
ncbi:MAG: NUDIX hydrolase [Acidobacteria bacterium]|nr:NUDIX hydrolase [Acidobacteriota bacterium]